MSLSLTCSIQSERTRLHGRECMKAFEIAQQMGLIRKAEAVHRILHIKLPLEQHGAPYLLIAHKLC